MDLLFYDLQGFCLRSFAVEFTTGAKQDLLKIYRYIKAAGRPKAAKRMYKQLSKACDRLS